MLFRVVSMVVLMCATTLPLLADNKSSSTKSSSKTPAKSNQPVRKPTKVKPSPKLIPEREAAALTFVRKNHADLEALLVYLKENSPNDYRRAILDLHRTSERLAQYQDRGDTQRYELALKAWQTQSRIQLIVTRLRMNDMDDLRAELKRVVNEQLDLRVQILNLDRSRIAERLKRLDDQISRITDDREKEVDRQMRLRTRSLKNKEKTSPRSARNKPAAADKNSPKSQSKKP